MEATEAAGAVVQVPSSLPSRQDSGTISPSESLAETDGREKEHGDGDEDEHSGESNATKQLEESLDGELKKMDWAQFEYNYTLQMAKLDDAENKVMDRVLKLSNVSDHYLKLHWCGVNLVRKAFMRWAEAGSNRDNTRLSKRQARPLFLQSTVSDFKQTQNPYEIHSDPRGVLGREEETLYVLLYPKLCYGLTEI